MVCFCSSLQTASIAYLHSMPFLLPRLIFIYNDILCGGLVSLIITGRVMWQR